MVRLLSFVSILFMLKLPPKQSRINSSPHPDKIAAILADDNFKCIFLMKMIEFRLEFQWNLFPEVQMTISQHWFRQWLGAEQATSHYLNQCWHTVHRRIYVVQGGDESNNTYRKTSNISRTLVSNKIVDNSDVVGASPVGAAPTTSSFST